MTTIANRATIQATPRRVWVALADFGNVSRMGPNIRASQLTSAQSEGVGSTRHCDLELMGATLEERVAAWEKERYLDIDIYEWTGLPLMRSMRAEFLLTPTPEGHTVLEARIHYAVGASLVGWLVDLLMLRPANRRTWRAFVAGIKQHVETGVHVDKSTRLDVGVVGAA